MARRAPIATLAALGVALALAGCGAGRDAAPPAGEPPAGAAEAQARAFDPEAVRPRGDRSVTGTIRALQAIGFFRGEDPAAAARRARRLHAAEWGEPLVVRTLLDELVLASYDRRRVWWQDIEADALEGNEVYADTLRGWGRISRGAFRPRSIEEDWDSPEGDATIRFDLRGTRRAVRARWADAWIDLCLLPQLNRLVARSGRRFEVVVPFDQTAYVVALTRAERRTLERDRGWRFAADAELRTANELGRVGERPIARGCG